MMKTEIYLEASALWDLFYGEPGDHNVQFCIESDDIQCHSSIWSHLEIYRGINKRINQDEITEEEGYHLRLFIDQYLDEARENSEIIHQPVSKNVIQNAKELMLVYNLYAADAVHLATAIIHDCPFILVDDHHFTRLENLLEDDFPIQILCVTSEKSTLESILKNNE